MKIDLDRLPNNLNDAVEMLATACGDADHDDFRAISKERPDFLHGQHDTLGRWIRNNWNLWEDSPIARWFINTYGICHADDMSGMIISAFEHWYNGKEYDPITDAGMYRAHWIKTHDGRLDTNDAMIQTWFLHNGLPEEKEKAAAWLKEHGELK